MGFVCLNTTTNYSFLQGASHPAELVMRAMALKHSALAITDECSLAGIVKAYIATPKDEEGKPQYKILIGSRFTLSNGLTFIALAPNKLAYAEISGFITLTRQRAPKGQYEAHFSDLRFRLKHCLMILCATPALTPSDLALCVSAFKDRLWLGASHCMKGIEQQYFSQWQKMADQYGIPVVAAGPVYMHDASCKPLQDVLTAIRLNQTIDTLGKKLQSNAEAHLKPLSEYQRLYPASWIEETEIIAQKCHFCLQEIQYQYPLELVPKAYTPIKYLSKLVDEGIHLRWPNGTSESIYKALQHELKLIEELQYEYYFLTVYDIVKYARSQNILCQGRGSAANSIVCYCLGITEISPEKITGLFERFISKERDEPPDIDVDFEHARREEVIQYIYQKYSRERAALAATVITYRRRSAIRDVGKALGFQAEWIDQLASSIAWWDKHQDLQKNFEKLGVDVPPKKRFWFYRLVHDIIGFPRHLSQHVGGFIIAQTKLSDLVPIENANMPNRTVIQWDKEDLEAMHLMKVDVLALGMLTALKKSLSYIRQYAPNINSLQDIPQDDKATYDMICKADTVGVFQIESRAQMSMLPRLKPKTFYDLVIEIAIVRPGPIQGDMVHPYLRRRHGEEETSYPNKDIQSVLERTLGIPIFQEQAIRLAMVAAGFSGGEADQLRRAMASWGKNGRLMAFEEKFIQGMLKNGYSKDFAQRLFEQIKGFGGYGFPESHSASFALLCYASCWIKRHHPAAFYCALLNSQPMGFYSPSQLIQDAQRHHIRVDAVDINKSEYENCLRSTGKPHNPYAIRLGFCRVASLNKEKAKRIPAQRHSRPFQNMMDIVERTGLSRTDLQHLAAADALKALTGDRHHAYWQAAAALPQPSLMQGQYDLLTDDELTTAPPSEIKDICDDYRATGLSLRRHPMALLREQKVFSRCKKQNELIYLSHGRFVQVAGLVTGRQRPGTAKGTIFVTLEDETGNINIVVWKQTQEAFRQALLNSRLLLVKGRIEISDAHSANPVIQIIAGQLHDHTAALRALSIKSRDFH